MTWPRLQMPSPAMVVALIALAVALSGTAYAATGGNFILGQSNSAGHISTLKNNKGSALALTSGGTGTPLTLTAPSGVAPLAVDSTTKVANLNADELDGLTAADLQTSARGSGEFSGPLPQTISGVLISGTALLIVTGSGYRTTVGPLELDLYACPGDEIPCNASTTGNILLGSGNLYTNEANSHKPLDFTMTPHLTPGTYSLGFVPSASTKTDLTDFFNLSLINFG